MADERTIFLITIFGYGQNDPDTERLVNADTRGKALAHAAAVNKASAADVARVLGAGGKVEDAA